MITAFRRYCSTEVDIAPLASLRFIFGVVMLVSLTRFYLKGWISSIYLTPSFHFKYWGFEWVTVPSEHLLYTLFILCFITCLFVALGFLYRFSSLLFFLSFTYIQLMDKSTYLNHYYFISIISFLLILVPAHKNYSIDSLLFPSVRKEKTAQWTILIFKLQMSILYIFAGVAKINSDWLLHGQPLKIWLRGKSNIPVIGWIVKYKITPYLFAWSGMLYDLLIPFILIYRRTRVYGYIAVLGFHILTSIFFPGIGMFPYIMMGITLIFFPSTYHKTFIGFLFPRQMETPNFKSKGASYQTIIQSVLIIHFILQLYLPLRYIAYPGQLFWNEEGFRYSWRVMLIEKAGYAQFIIKDPKTLNTMEVTNSDFLTQTQEKMMSTQPDLILEYAQHLHQYYANLYDNQSLEVYANIFVTLNGRKSRRFVNQHVNLAAQKENLAHKSWILPMSE